MIGSALQFVPERPLGCRKHVEARGIVACCTDLGVRDRQRLVMMTR